MFGDLVIVCVSVTHLDDTDSSDLIYYVLLRAVDHLFVDFNRYPGEYPDVIEMDIPALKVSR